MAKKAGSLKALRKGLYARNNKNTPPKRRSGLRPHEIEAPEAWQEDPHEEVVRMSGLTKLFLGSFVFFVVSLVAAFFVFFFGTNTISSENVSIGISAPVSVEAGSEVAFQVLVENNNDVALEFTDLIITYPEGTRMVGNVEQELKRSRASLDTIEPRQVATETLQAVFFGQEGVEREITVELEYRVAGSNAIFVTEKSQTVLISSSPINLSVESLSETSSGQDYEMEVRITSNSTEIVEDLLLEVDYPFGFSYSGATPQPIFDNNIWSIGDLEPNGERVITIRGSLSGQDGEEKAFRVESGVASSDNRNRVGVVYGSLLSAVEIVRPFLGLQLVLNGLSEEEYRIGSDEKIRGKVIWTNNVQTRISNAQIEVTLDGDVLDERTVTVSDGFFQSLDNTITWSGNTLTDLRSIEPGSRGEVAFEFSAKPLFTGENTVLRNPRIIVGVRAEGERLAESGVSEVLENTVTREVKIISDVGFTSRGLYFSGPFINVGALPPRVEQETTYTVVWTALNSSNTISQAKVEAVLPSYVRWVSGVSPASETVTYSDRDRTVTWDVGVMRGGVGITTPPREVAFQIAVTPSITDVGQVIDILSEARFTGIDEFADVRVERTSRAVTTNLTTDPQFSGSQARVAQ